MKQRDYVLFVAVFISQTATAQWFKKAKTVQVAPAAETAGNKIKLESIESKTKNCIKLKGIFNFYRDTNSGQLFRISRDHGCKLY